MAREAGNPIDVVRERSLRQGSALPRQEGFTERTSEPHIVPHAPDRRLDPHRTKVMM